MANRATGTFTFAANFETEFQGPLDARLTTPELPQLTDGSLPFAYNGMVVAVTEDEGRAGGSVDNNGLYILIDDSATPGGDINKWTKLGDAPGGGGNPVTAIAYTAATNELKVTLTHDGSGSGSALEYTTTVDPIYTSGITDTSTSVPNAVGGIDTSNTVADLNGLTQSQMWDKLLFPTVNPTASQPSASLSGISGLKIIGSSQSFTLNTGANQGTLSNPSGVYAGSVTAASISGPGGPYTLNVGPGATDIDNQAITHTAVEGTSGNSWTLTVTFDAGPMPLDSTGANFASLQFTGGNKTASRSFEGVHPYFLGNVGGTFDQASLVSHSAGTSVTSNVIQADQGYGEDGNAGLYHRISLPDTMVDGRTIQVWQYSTVSTQYAEATSAWVLTTETRTIEGQPVSYSLLTKSGSEGGSNLYRIKFV